MGLRSRAYAHLHLVPVNMRKSPRITPQDGDAFVTEAMAVRHFRMGQAESVPTAP